MKNNTEQAKALLEQAMRSLPQDFKLSETRSLILRALQSISHVESSRSEKQRSQELLDKSLNDRRDQGLPTGGYAMTTKEAHMAVSTLNKLISKEKKILEQLTSTKAPSDSKQIRVQTLHS